VLAGWRIQPVSIRLLRGFLGVTFLYAGIQKLADGNFLHPGSPDYIGSQLEAFAQGSPVGGLLRLLAHIPIVTGVAIALLEITVGLGTLLGIGPFPSAAAGLAINMFLFLSATWHVHPYFLGSDSIYAVAWAVYLVALREAEASSSLAFRDRRTIERAPHDASRRRFLRGGLVAAATLFVAGAAKTLAGPPTTVSRALGTPPGRRVPSRAAPGGSHPTTPSPAGRPIASLSEIPVGEAAAFVGPGDVPAVVVRLGADRVVAYSRICTHAGCAVGYDRQARLLVCPCHGAEFDPSRGARPVAGPAPTPLQPIRVLVDRATGEVVLPPQE
jgi:thiosulfate dehydrogenase [quinone] large subunit